MTQFRRFDDIALIDKANKIRNVVMQRTGPVAPGFLGAIEAAFTFVFRIAGLKPVVDFGKMGLSRFGSDLLRPDAR